MNPLVIGVGCRRNASADDIERAMRHALGDLSFDDISAIASIDAKRNEAGLRDFCDRHGFPLHFYSAAEIARVQVVASNNVLRHMKVDGVCEPCALLASGIEGRLVVPKTILGGVTVAIAHGQA